MRKYKQHNKVVTQTVIDQMFCNLCGNKLDLEYSPTARLFGTEVKAEGHYGSRLLEDCTAYHFDLCEECLVRLMSECKIAPLKGEYSVLDELYGADKLNVTGQSEVEQPDLIYHQIDPSLIKFSGNDSPIVSVVEIENIDNDFRFICTYLNSETFESNTTRCNSKGIDFAGIESFNIVLK
jgi:hypothetical protein